MDVHGARKHGVSSQESAYQVEGRIPIRYPWPLPDGVFGSFRPQRWCVISGVPHSPVTFIPSPSSAPT